MAIRANLAGTWAFLMAAAFWLRARMAPGAGGATLSNDWLLELERKSIRGHN